MAEPGLTQEGDPVEGGAREEAARPGEIGFTMEVEGKDIWRHDQPDGSFHYHPSGDRFLRGHLFAGADSRSTELFLRIEQFILAEMQAYNAEPLARLPGSEVSQ